MGKAEREKGHRFERLLATLFRSLGFERCQTSRNESRLLDGCGIDLSNIPYNIQAKAGIQRNLNYSKELKSIREKIIKNLGDDSERLLLPTCIIHQKNVGRGKRRESEDTLVIMTLDDFTTLISTIHND